jgi:hypothetical protein
MPGMRKEQRRGRRIFLDKEMSFIFEDIKK